MNRAMLGARLSLPRWDYGRIAMQASVLTVAQAAGQASHGQASGGRPSARARARLNAEAVPVVRVADDGDHLIGIVGHVDQRELGRADVGLGEHRVPQPAEQS
jgi:hypothetical protein